MSANRFHPLTPSQFENLAYDLLTWRGMRNAVWRTPGADGGRDIEGSYEVQDLSGTYQSQKWYVDCKRYKASVDWPTVYEKLSYADSNEADFLLIVCTPSVSPACRSEIDKWNQKTTKTKIRTWEPHYLEQLLIEHPEIAIKHGFIKATMLEAPGFVQLALEASKCADAAYSRSKFEDDKNVPELELASALANLLAAQMQQAKISTKSIEKRHFHFVNDSYDWIAYLNTHAQNTFELDAFAVRAILCLIRLSNGGNISLNITIENLNFYISLMSGTMEILKNNEDKLLKTICLFSSIEYSFSLNTLELRAQK